MIQEQVSHLEAKLIHLNETMHTTQESLQNLQKLQEQPSFVAPTLTAASQAFGVPVDTAIAPQDTESGFIQDAAIELFRKATLLFLSQHYDESILEFSSFLEKYPDHPLAGSAQFWIGECYFQKKEYRIALQEYQRILASYEYSSHLSDTLAQMARIADILNLSQDAFNYRQQLKSLFPQSPAQASLNASAPLEAPGESVKKPFESSSEILTAPLKPNLLTPHSIDS